MTKHRWVLLTAGAVLLTLVLGCRERLEGPSVLSLGGSINSVTYESSIVEGVQLTTYAEWQGSEIWMYLEADTDDSLLAFGMLGPDPDKPPLYHTEYKWLEGGKAEFWVSALEPQDLYYYMDVIGEE